MDSAKARKHMVDSQVRPNDVSDLKLQAAMATLPREQFVPADRKTRAYVEQDVPLFEGRWLLKARDFSKLINAANIQPSDIVLDVGCGYGYSTAVLAHMADVVVGVEDDEDVVAAATERLSALGIENAVPVVAPPAKGYNKQAPYDVIVVAGGVEDHLDPLLAQLKDEVGRLVTIKVNDRVGTATLYTRAGHVFSQRALFEAHPAGVMSGFERASQFVF